MCNAVKYVKSVVRGWLSRILDAKGYTELLLVHATGRIMVDVHVQF